MGRYCRDFSLHSKPLRSAHVPCSAGPLSERGCFGYFCNQKYHPVGNKTKYLYIHKHQPNILPAGSSAVLGFATSCQNGFALLATLAHRALWRPACCFGYFCNQKYHPVGNKTTYLHNLKLIPWHKTTTHNSPKNLLYNKKELPQKPCFIFMNPCARLRHFPASVTLLVSSDKALLRT